MAQKKIEELFNELGKKYGLPSYVIEEVYNSQFKKLKIEISSLDFPIIKLPGWGKYIPSKIKLDKYDYDKKRNERDEEILRKNGQNNREI